MTSYEPAYSDFVTHLLEKNRLATPLTQEARTLKLTASQLKMPSNLLSMPDIEPSVLVAAGISTTALIYLDDMHKREAILQLIEQYLEPAGEYWVEELVYRFLLLRVNSLDEPE